MTPDPGDPGPRAPASADAIRHFGAYADEYRRYRPDYPDALFDRVLALAPRPGRVWECGAGSGQATAGLAARFETVVATDVSRRQLSEIPDDPRVRRVVGAAEAAPLRGGSVDLVVVAQALHWFAPEAFAGEVRRVARPDGALVVWSYGLPSVGPEVDGWIRRVHDDVLGSYWRPERRHVVEGYERLPVPLRPLCTESWTLERRWPLARFLGYVGTWSAAREHRARHGSDPLAPHVGALAAAWGAPEDVRAVRWPLTLRAYAPVPPP